MSASRIDTAAGQQQVAHDGVSEISLQPWNAAKPGNQTQPQFRKTESSHLVGDDQVASQGELKAAPEDNTIHRCNRRYWKRIQRVDHAMNAIEEVAKPHGAFFA